MRVKRFRPFFGLTRIWLIPLRIPWATWAAEEYPAHPRLSVMMRKSNWFSPSFWFDSDLIQFESSPSQCVQPQLVIWLAFDTHTPLDSLSCAGGRGVPWELFNSVREWHCLNGPWPLREVPGQMRGRKRVSKNGQRNAARRMKFSIVCFYHISNDLETLGAELAWASEVQEPSRIQEFRNNIKWWEREAGHRVCLPICIYIH